MIGSRENKVYRYEPRENDAVNSCWMCDYGRLNYKWINREDRLTRVDTQNSFGTNRSRHLGDRAQRDFRSLLNRAPTGSVAIVGSARQTNEELYF